MAAFGPDISGSWLSTSGVVGFFILLLLLSIFLSALCSECSRRSFELKDSQVDKDPSTLIKVVKLEEGLVGTENPRINDLTDDTDLNPCDGNTYTPWRSHLVAPENQHDPNGSTAPHSVYQTMGGEGRDLTNHQPGAESSLPADGSSVYAQVSKKERVTMSPEEVLQKVSSPPLPDRKAQLEG